MKCDNDEATSEDLSMENTVQESDVSSTSSDDVSETHRSDADDISTKKVSPSSEDDSNSISIVTAQCSLDKDDMVR